MNDFSYLGPRLNETITMIQNAAQAFERLADEKLAAHRSGRRFVRMMPKSGDLGPYFIDPAAVTGLENAAGTVYETDGCIVHAGGVFTVFLRGWAVDEVATALGLTVADGCENSPKEQ